MAVSNPRPVSVVEDVLMCQICTNPLVSREPRTMQCLHTFCTPCLENIVARIPRNVTVVSCPICRNKTELPQRKVTNLPLSFSAKKIHDMVRALGQILSCQSCWKKEEYVYATVKCLTCDRRFCEECCDRHDQLPGFQAHLKTDIEREGNGRDSDMCPVHCSKYCKFCTKCNALHCLDCLLHVQHDAHIDCLRDIPETAEKVRSRLSSTENSLRIKIHERNAKLKSYVTTKGQVEKVKREVEDTADAMKTAIDLQRDQLLHELTEKSLKGLDSGIDFLTSVRDKERELLQAIVQYPRKGDCDLIKYQETMSEQENDLALAKNRLEAVKEPLSVSFNKGSAPLVGRIIFKDSAIRKNKMLKPKFVNRFRNADVACAFGVGALSNGTAVAVSSDKKCLVLYHSKTGCLTKLDTSTKVSCVSTCKDRILFGDCGKNCVYEVVSSNNKLNILKKYQIPCGPESYLTFDSSGHVVVTWATRSGDLSRYDLKGKCLWNKSIYANSPISIAVSSQRRSDRYITALASPLSVKIWNESGEQEGELNIAKGRIGSGFRGTTVTPTGTVLVAGYDNHTISEYGMDGVFIRHMITEDDGIKGPWDISCDSNGLLWITLEGGELVVFEL